MEPKQFDKAASELMARTNMCEASQDQYEMFADFLAEFAVHVMHHGANLPWPIAREMAEKLPDVELSV
ncbi:MAG: hypothetical protein ACJ788_24460 [Ktedonobacteraceae bacterium]